MRCVKNPYGWWRRSPSRRICSHVAVISRAEPRKGTRSQARAPKRVPHPDITLVRWPEEAERLERLRRDRLPRLLLVAPDAIAPPCGDCEEDWIRLPADDADVRTRLTSLTERWTRYGLGRDPDIDPAGRIRFQGRWVALSRIEQNLTGKLLEHMGVVVDHATLSRSTCRTAGSACRSCTFAAASSRSVSRYVPSKVGVTCSSGPSKRVTSRRRRRVQRCSRRRARCRNGDARQPGRLVRGRTPRWRAGSCGLARAGRRGAHRGWCSG